LIVLIIVHGVGSVSVIPAVFGISATVGAFGTASIIYTSDIQVGFQIFAMITVSATPEIFSRPGKNSHSLKQLPDPGKSPGGGLPIIRAWPK